MSDGFQTACNIANTGISYLQSLKVVEIRQSMEFIGVHHVEFLIALGAFLVLQFTKFTLILLLACLIAFTIFYMWDTLFPELREKKKSVPPFSNIGGGYGPRFGMEQSAGSPNTVSILMSSRDSFRDARTSATFPPFGNLSNHDGLPVIQPNRSAHDNSSWLPRGSSPPRRDSSQKQRRLPPSGAMTPIGHRLSASDLRSQKRTNNQMEEFRHLRRNIERDPQSFRRMIQNEYRASRPGTATDHATRHRYQAHEDRRRNGSPSPPDDRQSRQRRSSDNKSSSQKRSNLNEVADRTRSLSREHLIRKLRNYPAPTSHTSGFYNPNNSQPNAENRGSKRRSGMTRENNPKTQPK